MGRANTSSFGPLSINTGACHKDIVHDSEDAFAANPRPILVLDSTVVEYGRPVEVDASAEHSSGEMDLVRMEVLPARGAFDFVRQVAQ